MEFIRAFTQALRTHKAKQNRKAGTRAYYNSGEVYLSRVFSYKLVGDRYEPDEHYAPAIRTIFEMLAVGKKTLPEIKAALDSAGMRDSSNNRYSISRIVGIAERPVYAAHLLQHGKLTPIKNMTAIVKLDLWEAAQRQLKIERKKLVS